MATKRILYSKPSITELEIKYVKDAITNGWGDACYDYIKKFEAAFSETLEIDYSLSTSSCTGAIHIALKALGVGLGDEVIVPDCTWVASVAPLDYVGAKAVFVDIDKKSWCIDPEKIKSKITKKTKGIIAVHLYGNLCAMDELKKICTENNIFLLEDAAEALGSKYRGKYAGTMGDVGVFSFHGTKTITTGEGGMLVTNNPDLFKKIKVISDHGRNPQEKKMFWPESVGLKYKMSNLEAALGLAQISRLNELVDKKRDIFFKYKALLQNFEDIIFNDEPEYCINSFWMPTVYLPNITLNVRDQMISELNFEGIAIRPFFYPLSQIGVMGASDVTPVSLEISTKSINLPSNFEMDEADISRVVNSLKSFVSSQKVKL